MPRTIAIGDIHGCSVALAKLIELIDPQPDDVLVPLGDFVDRGIDSKGVIKIQSPRGEILNDVVQYPNHA